MSNFWSFVALMFWWMVMVAFLMLLFQIFGDLFRDKDTSGFVKAVWVVALVLATPLTALVYLIVRGKGMAERQGKQVAEMMAAQDAYIRQAAGTSNPAEQIAQARQLLEAGHINQAEFDTLKAKALA